MMFGLAAIADNLIIFLFTTKWSTSGLFLGILCIGYSFYPIHSANLQAIYAIGESGIVLKLEIIKKVLGTVLIFISIPFGVYAVTGSVVIMSIISTVINSVPNAKYIGYSFREQLADVSIYYVMSVVMAVIIYAIGIVIPFKSVLCKLLLQIAIGIVIYLLQCLIIRPYAYKYSIDLIKRKIK